MSPRRRDAPWRGRARQAKRAASRSQVRARMPLPAWAAPRSLERRGSEMQKGSAALCIKAAAEHGFAQFERINPALSLNDYFNVFGLMGPEPAIASGSRWRMISQDNVFGLFSRLYDSQKETEMSLEDYLKCCAREPMAYASAAERMLAAIGEARDHRYQPRSAAGPHLHEPHDPGLSRLRRFLRHGRDDRAHRRLLPPCGAGAGRAQAGALSARPGRRRQIVARRAAQAADGEDADLRAEGRQGDQPGLREPARACSIRCAWATSSSASTAFRSGA